MSFSKLLLTVGALILSTLAHASLRDGTVVPKSKSGTGNDAAQTIYIYAPVGSPTVQCLFEPRLKPVATIRWDVERSRVWVSSGWPIEHRLFQNVRSRRGLAPFEKNGLTLETGKGQPIVSFNVGPDPKKYASIFAHYDVEAAWGALPGLEPGFRGHCWSR